MDTIHHFSNLDAFLSAHPDVHLDELLVLEDAIRYYKRLGGKSLESILATDTERKLYTVASELEISKYKSRPRDVLMGLVVEKYEEVFRTVPTPIQQHPNTCTKDDNAAIQAPLVLGPPVEICVTDDCDVLEHVRCNDIEFVEDSQGHDTVPVHSTVLDFLRPTVRSLYKNVYRSLKWYKGRYYQYTSLKGWCLIESLEEATKDLLSIVCNNTRNRGTDYNKLYLYLERNDRFRMMLRRVLLKNMETTVKTHSMHVPVHVSAHVAVSVPVPVPVSSAVRAIPVATVVDEASTVAVVRTLLEDLVDSIISAKCSLSRTLYEPLFTHMFASAPPSVSINNKKRMIQCTKAQENDTKRFFSK